MYPTERNEFANRKIRSFSESLNSYWSDEGVGDCDGIKHLQGQWIARTISSGPCGDIPILAAWVESILSRFPTFVRTKAG
jgi:hypothetical protein